MTSRLALTERPSRSAERVRPSLSGPSASPRSRSRWPSAAAIAGLLAAGVAPLLPARHGAAAAPAPTALSAAPYRPTPLTFEANQGQADASVRFLASGASGTMYFTPSEVVLASPAPSVLPSTAALPEVATTRFVHLNFVGRSLSAQIHADQALPGRVNYLLGNDPGKWHRQIPTYSGITYGGIYPGIDLSYTAAAGALKGTYSVAPGASTSQIRWSYPGARDASVAPDGALQIHFPASTVVGDASPPLTVTEAPPVSWQDVDGVRHAVKTTYQVGPDGTIGFVLEGYDRSRSLVIDPTITYSTYMGGGSPYTSATTSAVGVDGAGNAYVTGTAAQVGFPTTSGSYQTSAVSNYNVFVTKLDPTGSALVYSTYIGSKDLQSGSHDTIITAAGGTQPSKATSIWIDKTCSASCNAFIAGYTYLSGRTFTGVTPNGYPTTPGAYQPAFAGGQNAQDGIFTELNAEGSDLVYSTFLGSGADGVKSLAMQGGSAYLTGFTADSGFPTTPGSYQPNYPIAAQFNNLSSSYVAKLTPAGKGKQDLAYSTFLEGSVGGGNYTAGSYGGGAQAIAVDTSGAAYVAGSTLSNDFPTTAGARQRSTVPSSRTPFVTKLNPAGSALLYSTYLGGSQQDDAHGIAIDAAGDAYVAGSAASADFPTTAGAAQPNKAAGQDAFISKLNPTGSSLLYSTYLGGGGTDSAAAIAVDGSADAYVVGSTTSADFPVADAVQPTYGGGGDAFLTKLDPAGAHLAHSTFLGGGSADAAAALALGSAGVLVTGPTTSSDFPTTRGSNQPGPSLGGSFLTQLSEVTSRFVGDASALYFQGVTLLPGGAAQRRLSDGGQGICEAAVNSTSATAPAMTRGRSTADACLPSESLAMAVNTEKVTTSGTFSNGSTGAHSTVASLSLLPGLGTGGTDLLDVTGLDAESSASCVNGVSGSPTSYSSIARTNVFIAGTRVETKPVGEHIYFNPTGSNQKVLYGNPIWVNPLGGKIPMAIVTLNYSSYDPLTNSQVSSPLVVDFPAGGPLASLVVGKVFLSYAQAAVQGCHV